jgi:hypothetical protein
LDKKDRTKFVIGLWSICVKKWTSYKQDQQWSLSSSKWSSSTSKDGQNVERRKFVVEYLMGAFESLLDSTINDLDNEFMVKLVEVSKVSS